jgi:hypothetical protein
VDLYGPSYRFWSNPTDSGDPHVTVGRKGMVYPIDTVLKFSRWGYVTQKVSTGTVVCQVAILVVDMQL